MKNPVWLLTACLLAFISVPSHAQENGITRGNLKSLVAQSLSYPQGLQDVRIGPFNDGRFVRLQIEYLLTSSGTKLTAKDNKPLCISIDRMDMAKGNMILDGFEQCRTLGICDRMTGYINRVWQAKTVDDMPFIEEGDPRLTEQMKNWRISPAGAQRWVNQFLGVTLAVQTHEIAHAVLHDGVASTAATEAEADGFAAAFTEMAGIPISAAALHVALTVDAERNYRVSSGSHPPSECRVEAFHLGLRGWYDKYPQFTLPMARTTPSPRPIPGLEGFLPTNDRLCAAYAPNFHRGVTLAAKLVSQNTGFDFLFEGFGDRCEINGGNKR